jgi:hypothetical protein
MGSFGARHTFLILTSSQERFARLFGLLPAGSVEGLAQVLRTSPSFRLVHARGDASIFRYKPRDEPRPP